MAIKVNKVTVIDDNRNIVNVKNFTPSVSSTRYSTSSLQLTLDNAVGDTGFGTQIKRTSSAIVVSAPNQTNVSGKQTGRVYLYAEDGTKYAEIINPSTSYGTFGASLAASEYSSFDVLLVGNQSANNNAVYVYEYIYPSQGQPSLQRTINNPNTRPGWAADKFGWCVDIGYVPGSGIRYVVGAPGEANTSGTVGDTGVIHVFNSNGSLQYTIENPTGATGNLFGSKFVCSGTYLIVTVENVGVYIYDLTTGVLVKTITNTFGYSTFANNVTAQVVNTSFTSQPRRKFAIAAKSTATSGRVLVYEIDRVSQSEANLELVHNLYSDVYTSDNGSFGESLSMNEEFVMIGAPRAYNDQRGMAYLYSLTEGKLSNAFDGGYTTAGKRYADTVYISQTDDIVLVGIKNYGFESAPTEGRVELYKAEYAYNIKSIGTLTYYDDTVINKGFFEQNIINHPKFRNTNGIINSGYGWSTCLSEDYLIVGAPLVDVTGENVYADNNITLSNNLGAVYVYDRETNALRYKIEPPAAIRVENNTCFGHTVRTDGKILAVGAGGEVNMLLPGTTGSVSVYDLDTGTFLFTVSQPINDFGKGIDVHPGGMLAVTAPSSSNVYLYNSLTGTLRSTISSYGASISGRNRIGLFGKDNDMFLYVHATNNSIYIFNNVDMTAAASPLIHTVIDLSTYGISNAYVGWGAEVAEIVAYAAYDRYTSVMIVRLTNNDYYIALVDYYADPYVQAYEKLPAGIVGSGMMISVNSKTKRAGFAPDDVPTVLHRTMVITADGKDTIYILNGPYSLGSVVVDGVRIARGTTISISGDTGGLNAHSESAIRDISLNGVDVSIGLTSSETLSFSTNKLGQVILRPMIQHSVADRIFAKYSRA